jgi:hypothetical protein
MRGACVDQCGKAQQLGGNLGFGLEPGMEAADRAAAALQRLDPLSAFAAQAQRGALPAQEEVRRVVIGREQLVPHRLAAQMRRQRARAPYVVSVLGGQRELEFDFQCHGS